MVTKLGPLCKVKLLKDKGDTLVVRSPEKAGVGDHSPGHQIFKIQSFAPLLLVHYIEREL